MNKAERKLSIFYTLIFMITICAIMVFYISNIIYVNNLAFRNNLLKEDLKKTQQTNDLLQSDIEKLSSYEKIKGAAFDKFGLVSREQHNNETDNIIINRSEEF